MNAREYAGFTCDLSQLIGGSTVAAPASQNVFANEVFIKIADGELRLLHALAPFVVRCVRCVIARFGELFGDACVDRFARGFLALRLRAFH